MSSGGTAVAAPLRAKVGAQDSPQSQGSTKYAASFGVRDPLEFE